MPDTALQHIYFGRSADNGEPFSRVNEAVNTEKLRPGELVQLDNMRLDEEIGTATTRKGFSRYHNAVDTGGKINSIFDVKDINGNNYLLTQIGTKLRKSLNGSAAYSDVKAGLTNAKLRMAIYGDKFYFTNNNEKPFYTDLTNVYNMEIARPDISNIVTDYNGATGLFVRWSMWLLVYVTDDGQQSNPSIAFALTYQYNTDTSDVDIAGIPVSSDPRVVSKKLYRTKDKDYQNFYLVAILDNSATSYNDKTLDDSLDSTDVFTSEYLNVPIKAKYLIANNERLVTANFIKYATNRVVPLPHYMSTGFTPVTDDTVAGNISAGTYKYGLSLVDRMGNESEIVPYFQHVLGTNNKKIEFYIVLFPLKSYIQGNDLTTYEYDASIKYIRIYRTKAGGSTYYYLQDYTVPPIDYAHVIDNTNDSGLTQIYPIGNGYNEQLNLKTGIVVTNLYKPLEFPELNTILIYPDDGDEITGIFEDDNGIMIFKQKSICKLYTANGNPDGGWFVKKIVENTGCDEPDSIFKWGNTYFFMYQKRPYFLNGPSPENIGETRKNTFDSITEVTGASFWNKAQWYILSVKIGSLYYLLCYDTKLKGWYKFTINKADTITKKEYGTDAGIILIGGNLYVVYYNESVLSDSDNGITANIGVTLKTRDCTTDNFVPMRLFKLFLNYLSLGVTIPKSLVFKLIDPTTGIENYYTDIDNTSIENNFDMPTDAMIGTLKRPKKVNFYFTGFGMKKFYAGRLDHYPEPWNIQKRFPTIVEGFGMQQGTKAGVND